MSVPITATSASEIQMNYMKLLVAQLQNQNPLEPLDNNQMASQLAQLSQLGQVESLNASFARVLEMTERSYAGSLVGKTVAFYSQTENEETAVFEGVVEQVFNDIDGKVCLSIGGNAVALDDVVAVRN